MLRFARLPALFLAICAMDAPGARADDWKTCFSIGSNDFKNEAFVAKGLEACTQVIASRRVKGADLGRVYITRGYWQHRRGQLDAAMVDYNKGLDIAPADFEGYDYRADLWSDMGNDERALADYEQSIRVNPKYSAAHLSRGRIYEKRGEIERARTEYNKVLSLPAPNRIAEWAQSNARKRLEALAAKK